MREQEFRAAAWVPYADQQALEDGMTTPAAELDWLGRRTGLATAWVRERAHIDGTGLVLRVHSRAHDYQDSHHRLSNFAADATVLTNKGGRSRTPAAVLVDEGHPAEIERGMDDADGSSILILEHPAFPLEGWAMTLGALNLRTMQPTPDTRTAKQIELLDDLIDSLYGGWSHPMGKRIGPTKVAALADTGMTRAVFEGSLLALDPQKHDRKAIERHLPPAWRGEATARLEQLSKLLRR